ncbi:hypothetical protein [Phascolarctobacterium sp.]|uniref:hypothetical protein n=1 Tax=Phascolarctobacterium sp. TaxID=2049039 RepID=UPI00386DCCEF
MKHAPYAASNEMQEIMWLSAARQMFERIIKTTADKDWLRRIRTADTNVKNVLDARVADLNQLELKKFARRVQTVGIKVYHYDDARVDKSDHNRTYTISQDDFLDLVDAAFLNCYACKQGDIVKDCPRRKLYHRLGLQVHALRESPKQGQCEFRCDDDPRYVTPQYECKAGDQIEPLP